MFKKFIMAIYLIAQIGLLNGFMMPSKEILETRLRENGFNYFMEKTDIVETLAGTEKVALGVNMEVELAYYHFEEYMRKGNAPKSGIITMRMRQSQLIKCLLQEFPEAIAELESMGLLEKKSNSKL